MHSLLENYLAEVTVQLGPLPAKRRDDEVNEMRQHLLNAVIVNREMGMAEDEAAATAVEQCGPPEEATQGLVRAWRQGEQKKNARNFWRRTALFSAVFIVEGILRPHVIVPMIPMILFVLIIFAVQRLTPQNPSAWWSYRGRPKTLAQCWRSTAMLGVVCLYYLFTVPRAAMQLPLLTLVSVFMLCYVWMGRLWTQRRGGSGPTGPLPER